MKDPIDIGEETFPAVLYLPDVALIFEALAEMVRDRGLICRSRGTNLEDDEGYKRIARSWDTLQEQVKRCEMVKDGKEAVFAWDVDLSTLIGRKVKVETWDGVRRVGVLGGVIYGKEFEIFGRKVSIPKSITFQGENTSDAVGFESVRSIIPHVGK